MTTLEPKSTSLISQIIWENLTEMAKLSREKCKTLVKKNYTYVKGKRDDQVIYASKSRKNPEKSFLFFFINFKI